MTNNILLKAYVITSILLGISIPTNYMASATTNRDYEIQNYIDSIKLEINKTGIHVLQNDSEKTFKNIALIKKNLLRPKYYNRLKYFSADLIQLLNDYAESEDSSMILGLVNLPDEMIADLIKLERTPDITKARLGDSDAEKRIFNKFNNANRYTAKRKLAFDLLYIGNSKAIQLFSEGIESDSIFVDYQENKLSSTQIMIQAYGEVNSDIKLFSPEEYLKHCYISVEEFMKLEHQKYLREIEAFFYKKYGIVVSIKSRFLILGEPKVHKYKNYTNQW